MSNSKSAPQPNEPASAQARRRQWLLGTAAASVGLAAGLGPAGPARAQAGRVVKIVVPFAAGGVQDIAARSLSVELGQALDATCIVENRPGAGGTIGTGMVARSAPDGNTLVLAAASHTITASLYARLPYDPIKDFTGVGHLGSASYVLMINGELPARTVAEFIALVRANPGKFNYASAGNGSATHLSMAYLVGSAGLDMVHLPLKATGEAINEVLSGRAQAVIAANIGAMPFVNDPRVRLLATTGPKRSRFLPNLPTVAESGLPGYQFDSWFGLLAPSALPPADAQRINAAVARMLKEPAVLERLAHQGVEVMPMSVDAFDRLLRADAERMAKVVKTSGARID